MSRTGGAAHKFGSHYEGKRTVSCMLDVFEVKATSTCIKALDLAEAGVEFRVEYDGT